MCAPAVMLTSAAWCATSAARDMDGTGRSLQLGAASQQGQQDERITTISHPTANARGTYSRWFHPR